MKLRHYKDVTGRRQLAVEGRRTVLITSNGAHDYFKVWYSDELRDILVSRSRGAAISRAIKAAL